MFQNNAISFYCSEDNSIQASTLRIKGIVNYQCSAEAIIADMLDNFHKKNRMSYEIDGNNVFKVPVMQDLFQLI